MSNEKMTWGQVAVLVLAATPMAAVGIAGGVATYVNMDNVLHRGASALGLVAAGEGATLIAALVALAVTLMGQHTPTVVRLAMWVVPLVAAGAGIALAPTMNERVVMGVTPLAMTAAGEGVAFVARRVVAYRTGVDVEQQRRSGLLLWHANRAANGSGLGRWMSRGAVWRLTRQFAATDGQLSVQLGEIQRYRISQGADENLSAVLTRGAESAPALPPAGPVALPATSEAPKVLEASETTAQPLVNAAPAPMPKDDGWGFIAGVLAEAEAKVTTDSAVKLLTTAEVAAQKGVSPGTVRSWKHRGKLAPFEVVDGTPMYHPNDVAKLD